MNTEHTDASLDGLDGEMNLQEAIQVLTNRVETLEFLSLDENALRPRYADLTGEQKDHLTAIKLRARDLWVALDKLGASREMTQAKIALDEAVMWATKHVDEHI